MVYRVSLTVGNGAKDDSNNNKAFFGFTNGATVKNIAFTSAVVKGYKQAANPGQLFVAKVF